MKEAETNLGERIEQGLRLVARRRWWFLGTACGVAIATVVVVSLLPERYQSEASLEIVQQLVSQRYVQAAETTTANDVVEAMKREILSRTRLLAIIDEFGLYKKSERVLCPKNSPT